MSIEYLSCDAYTGAICLKFNNCAVDFSSVGQTYGSVGDAQNIRQGIRYGRYLEDNEVGDRNVERICNALKPEVISGSRADMERLLVCPLFNYSSLDYNTGTIVRLAKDIDTSWYDWKGTCANITVSSFDIGDVKAYMKYRIQGNDWDIINRSAMISTVWADVWYQYDFDNYNKNSLSNGPSQLHNYINHFKDRTTRVAELKIPDNITSLYYKMIMTKALFTDFYNQIYITGYYNSGQRKNPLVKDYIKNPFDRQSKAVFVSQLLAVDCGVSTNVNCIDSELKTIWLDNLNIPVCHVEGSDCYIDFDLSASLYLEYKNSSESLDSFINKLLNNFFIDNDSSVRLTIGGVTITPKTALYEQTVFRYGLENSGNFISLTNNNIVRNFVSPSILMTIPMRTKVKRFSASLVAYFSANFPNAVIMNGSKIRADTDIIASAYFQSVSDSAKVDLIKNYCDTNYTPSLNQPISLTTFQQYMLNNNTGICLCYCSKLVPLNNSQKCGNKSAMCFDSACSDEQLSILGASNCGSACTEICGWSKNSGSNTFRNPATFNPAKFATVCGYSCDNALNRKTNLMIPILGSITTVLFAVLAFFWCIYYKLGKTTIIIVVVSVLFTLSGLTVFFTDDFKCLPRCGGEGGKTPQCITKHTKMAVPTLFCSPNLACECQFGVAGDCSRECSCISTVCMPLNGQPRRMKSLLVREPNIVWIIFCLIIGLIIIGISFLIYNTYKIDISDQNYIGLTIIIVSIPFSLLLYDILAKKHITVVDGSC